MRSSLVACTIASTICVGSVARAGGYDTPMLYSARHMGMGGAAIGYVDDPSALFHNPSGLGQVQRGEALGDFSLLLGKIRASPSAVAKDVTSDLTTAPFFLVGAAYRVHPRIVLGVGVYPVASAGATFHYGAPGFEDTTELFFLEASPGIAFNILPNLRIGAGYRITYVRLKRYEGNPTTSETPFLDFTVTGENYTGFRVGAQYDPLPWLDFGVVYRNPTITKVSNDHGTALALEFQDVSTKFKLPAKLGLGSRADFDQFGFAGSVAVDWEYTFNSENTGYPLIGTQVMPGQPAPAPTSVPNVFDWSDSQTVRVGFEYRFLDDPAEQLKHVAARVGYVYDSKTANAEYPTPFGTPPGPTQIFTLGTGYNGGTWQANLAYAYRFGTGAVTQADLSAPGRQPCQFCGSAGKQDYAIHLHGLYVDVSYKF
ncbi:MAG TPA: outer membrane protein transport protein [Polyangiaceae bacterium]|jgi:long-subunit fatty acid transport protein|nr:outer membrane protein transport protein [Polyangiaceae bacterium]